MKKEFLILSLLLLFSNLVVALDNVCDLDISLLNQDPYPAIPGDYVKLVFQADGLDNPNCYGDISLSLQKKYPLEFDTEESRTVTVKGGTYTKDFSSFLIAPFKVRISKDALEGDTPIELTYFVGGRQFSKQFDINIDDVRADFEVYIDDYSNSELSFEILNIGTNDVEALTLEIPPQEGIEIVGANRQILGDLDSNEYSSVSFSVPAITSKEIFLKVFYTDTTGTRRILEKSVQFDASYFENLQSSKSTSSWAYAFWILVLIFVGKWAYKKYWKNRKKRD